MIKTCVIQNIIVLRLFKVASQKLKIGLFAKILAIPMHDGTIGMW